jgi:ubiquitin C-terminal hydrolase
MNDYSLSTRLEGGGGITVANAGLQRRADRTKQRHDRAGGLTASHGIANVGNSCYAAAVIQALGHCPRFLRWACASRPVTGAASAATREILLQVWGARGRSRRPDLRTYLDALQACPGVHLDLREQNDAHEFLIAVLDQVSEEHARGSPPTPSAAAAREEAAGPVGGGGGAAAARLGRAMRESWSSAVGRFGCLGPMLFGQSVVQTKCGACGALCHTSDVFLTLGVDLAAAPDGATPTVEQCIERTMRDEAIDDGLRCEACGAVASPARPAIRSARLWRLPALLVVCVRRFRGDGRKDDRPVALAAELDVGRWVCAASPDPAASGGAAARYALRSIVCHVGCARSGHYVATCRALDDSSLWTTYDDDRIEPAARGTGSRSSAYIALFELVPELRR